MHQELARKQTQFPHTEIEEDECDSDSTPDTPASLAHSFRTPCVRKLRVLYFRHRVSRSDPEGQGDFVAAETTASTAQVLAYLSFFV